MIDESYKIAQWGVVPLTLRSTMKHACQLKDLDGRLYVFRYAYNTPGRAQEVLNTLRADVGRPNGLDRDLGANYWRVSSALLNNAQYATTPSEHGGWFIVPTTK